MISFIVRRLIVTVFLLLLVSLMTFAIFFLIPRLAGQTSYELAQQYVGRNPTPSAVHAVERKLGFDQSLLVQYGRFVKGIVMGGWSQPVEAIELRLSPGLSARRSSANTSAGVLNPSIARGRSFISSATA